MNGEWCYYKQYFTKDVCERIIEEGLKLPHQSGNLGVDGQSKIDDYRKSTVRFIYKNNPDFSWLFQDMWKMAIESNDQWFGFHLSKLDYIQLAEYDSSYEGEYKRHHDVFWMNGDSNYHRKLTAVIQLSDPNDYEGGELVLHNQQEKPNANDIKTQGSVIFFPSFIEHQANKVTKGKRYSLACWFDGPKWR
jgi:PKHD-type hydroxylase